MTNELWIGIAAQIPVVVAFMVFMIKWQQSQHDANDKNHKIWQRVLEDIMERNRSERIEWREWLRTRDERNIRAMTMMEQQIQGLSNIILAFMAAGGEGASASHITDTLKEFNRAGDE